MRTEPYLARGGVVWQKLSLMESRETLSLDRLPFDCIVTLCEYFSAEDLARFGRVCTVRELMHIQILLGWAS